VPTGKGIAVTGLVPMEKHFTREHRKKSARGARPSLLTERRPREPQPCGLGPARGMKPPRDLSSRAERKAREHG
jgi:hypothetical protein